MFGRRGAPSSPDAKLLAAIADLQTRIRYLEQGRGWPQRIEELEAVDARAAKRIEAIAATLRSHLGVNVELG